MRSNYRLKPSLHRPNIEALQLNLNCRDEIIPILRALQHLYADPQTLRKLLVLVSKDVNANTSPKHGRQGLDYWSILVLAAVRLGCNFDYDKLQDLAEQHRSLRILMGIGEDDEHLVFDWRRIRDNLSLLKTETLKKINQQIVAVGHQLVPEAIHSVRGDTFVVETNIHYPTESSLIGDGLRKVLKLAAELAAEHTLPGWRQHQHLLKQVKQITRQIDRAARSKKQKAERLRSGYENLLTLAGSLLQRARLLLVALNCQAVCLEGFLSGVEVQKRELQHYIALTAQVCGTARRRVLLGETVPNDEKLFSLFEPHTELIQRGKQPEPIQYGHKVLVVEDAAGFLCDYQVLAHGVLDQDILIPVMTRLQRWAKGEIQHASFDRAFHTPKNQEELATLVDHPCLVAKGHLLGASQHQEASVEFRQARQRHPGVESAIGALQSGNGQERCRDKTEEGYERYVGLGMLGRNLQVLGKVLLAKEQASCEAAKSHRKKRAA